MLVYRELFVNVSAISFPFSRKWFLRSRCCRGCVTGLAFRFTVVQDMLLLLEKLLSTVGKIEM